MLRMQFNSLDTLKKLAAEHPLLKPMTDTVECENEHNFIGEKCPLCGQPGREIFAAWAQEFFNEFHQIDEDEEPASATVN